MTPAGSSAAALKKWLGTESGYAHTLTLAGKLKRDSLQQGAFSIYLRQRFSCSEDDLRDEIAQEFLTFLLQTFLPQIDKNPDLVNAILTDQVRKVLSYALQKFSWRLQDAARQKDSNPRAYLHRRIREVLQKNNAFILHKDAQNRVSFSSASHAGSTPENFQEWSTVDYTSWAVPPDLADRNTLFTAKYLSAVVHFFLEEFKSQSGTTWPVPVRELVRYLSEHLSWLTAPQLESLPDKDSLAAPAEQAEEHFARIAALKSIAALARQFTLTMSEEARAIFFWRLADPPISFKDIAGLLDFDDHNRPYSIHRKIIAALQLFCSNWPGPPLGELPEEVGIAFIEEIRKECKKSVR